MAAGGAALGASGGASLGAATLGVGTLRGALLGAGLLGLGEPITSLIKPQGQLKPLPWRILASAFPAALFGLGIDVAGRRPRPVASGALSGAWAGAVGLNVKKVALGAAVGAGVGGALSRADPRLGGPVVAAASVVAFRIASAVLWRGETQLDVMGERVPKGHIPHVVPFESRRRYVGGDYLRELQERIGGRFERNPPDIGIVQSLEALAGPTFDPSRVHPLIHGFYAHTSRFELDIVPEWNPLVRPAYWIYKSAVARPLGQANIPSNLREAQRGMSSWIDTLDSGDGDAPMRSWVRAFADSGEPICVGIYTTVRHDGVGYVSVGFPIPSTNFTVTLQPFNSRVSGLLLSTHSDRAFPGHYVSVFEKGGEDLSVVKLNTMDEEIDVFVEDGRLRTDHRFTLWGRDFLTLRYSMRRKG